MHKSIAIALLAASLAASARADTSECEIDMLATYPFPHRPTKEQAQALKDCEAEKPYYGIGMHFDYVKARQCAFAKDDHEVLMMLYANGLGVPRNYAVAKMAACRAGPSAIETPGRLSMLTRMQMGQEGPSPKIDMCDDVSSTVLQVRCTAIATALAGQERDEKIDRMSSRWSDAQKAALLQLRKQAAAFADARSNGEVDRSGSGAAAYMSEEANAQQEDFLKSLLDFENRKLPDFTQEDALKAEREMNEVFLRLKRSKDPGNPGLVQFAGIESAQRSWMAYRDAWVAFGKVRYPAVSAYAWKAYFTRKRIPMLKEQLEFRRD